MEIVDVDVDVDVDEDGEDPFVASLELPADCLSGPPRGDNDPEAAVEAEGAAERVRGEREEEDEEEGIPADEEVDEGGGWCWWTEEDMEEEGTERDSSSFEVFFLSFLRSSFFSSLAAFFLSFLSVSGCGFSPVKKLHPSSPLSTTRTGKTP